MKTYADFDLTNYNSYRIKAACSKAFFPDTEEDVLELFHSGQEFIFLGSGHNVILSKAFYENNFLLFNGNFNKVCIENNIIEAEAGISTLELSELAQENGLSGLEVFYDIPSSLGGAVVMNAGASGEEIKDILVKVRFLDLKDLQVKELMKEDLGFEYRNSFFQRNKDKIVLKAWIQLNPAPKDQIRNKMEDVKSQRWSKQPKEFPNAGSVFKRPPGHYVGTIIEEMGLKGFAIGGAKISEKHGGFIINFDNATGKDILDLINHVSNEVHKKYGFFLEQEQIII